MEVYSYVSIAALECCDILAEALLRISGFISNVSIGGTTGWPNLPFSLNSLNWQIIIIKCNNI